MMLDDKTRNIIENEIITINNIVKIIKERIEMKNHIRFFICLNDKNITLNDEYEKIADFDIESEINMSDFIQEMTKRLFCGISIQDQILRIITQSFAGYNTLINDGPIQLFLTTESGRNFLISYSSNDYKQRKWLLDFVHYIENQTETEETEEFRIVRDFLYDVEDGYYNNIKQESNGKSK